MLELFTKKSKGFTLIELLVVIAIIAILAVIVLIALNNARTKARDSRAQSDVRSIVPALEMYNDDAANGHYPIAASFADMWTALAGPPAYVTGAVPSPPSGTYTYNYCANQDGSLFKLWASGCSDANVCKVLGDATAC